MAKVHYLHDIVLTYPTHCHIRGGGQGETEGESEEVGGGGGRREKKGWEEGEGRTKCKKMGGSERKESFAHVAPRGEEGDKGEGKWVGGRRGLPPVQCVHILILSLYS